MSASFAVIVQNPGVVELKYATENVPFDPVVPLDGSEPHAPAGDADSLNVTESFATGVPDGDVTATVNDSDVVPFAGTVNDDPDAACTVTV
ncbi:hypothetical protein ACFFRE_13600, partial [Aciditerrimonas ferrireducens]